MKIIYENEDYLIINKPAGLIVHGGNGVEEKTLVDFLLEKYPQLENIGEDPERPAIVHRLDKEASGLMIIPKNNPSFKYFKSLFQERKIEKEYTALVYGQLSKDEDVINFPIKRASSGHKMAAIPKPKKATEENEGKENVSNRELGNIKAFESSREAITSFSTIKKMINFTLLKVKIKTGRTHQIRVHFSAYGHPLLGDNLYGNKKIKTERIFLEATRLAFVDPKKEKQEFRINLGEDLEEILKRVK